MGRVMGYERIKTEMRGLTSRWGPRADIKRAADRLRREADKRACAEDQSVTARRSVANVPAMDAAGIPALIEAIRHLHGLEATWLESVPVHEQHEGKTVWKGEVQVFAVEHPKASRVYAWSHETTGTRRQFHAVLGMKPVDGARMAVRAAIVAQAPE
jgi:hypothetical protein